MVEAGGTDNLKIEHVGMSTIIWGLGKRVKKSEVVMLDFHHKAR